MPGPAPKDPRKRARRNADAIATTVLRHEVAEAPDLPSVQIEQDGKLVEFVWPTQTQLWWSMWRDSPQADTFGSTDWSFLLDTALLHARFWLGNMSMAGELRLRVAKFGATPEDRARLRMQFAQADEADAKRPAPVPAQYGDLRVVDGAAEAG